MSDLKVNDTKIVIKKNKGIAYALQDLVKSKPNSILSDGKITLKEWNSTMDKLVEINDKRIQAKQAPIFTGGTDKTKAGWHKSFVVHPNQEINFSEDELQSLYSAMGVTFKAAEDGEATSEATLKPDSTLTLKPDSTLTLKRDGTIVADEANKQVVINKHNVIVGESEIKTNTDGNVIENKATATAEASYSLSWGEIRKTAVNSTVNFFKGMFFDEKGFSPARAAMTVGTVGALVFAAPIAAAAGASAAVVGGIAFAAKGIGLGMAAAMAYNGGKNIIQGTKNYYNSKTEEEAKANMSQAMDGTVEFLTAAPAFFAVKGINNKAAKSAKPKSTPP